MHSTYKCLVWASRFLQASRQTGTKESESLWPGWDMGRSNDSSVHDKILSIIMPIICPASEWTESHKF
jgi:hypothetical protein